MESGRFLPIKIGEGGYHFGKDDLFFFYVTTFSNWPLLGVPSYSVGGGVTDSWENMNSQLAVSLGKVADRDRKHLGEGAPRERRHPG